MILGPDGKPVAVLPRCILCGAVLGGAYHPGPVTLNGASVTGCPWAPPGGIMFSGPLAEADARAANSGAMTDGGNSKKEV